MIKGHVTGEGDESFRPTDLTWTEETSGDIYYLANARGWLWSKSGTLPGFMCGHCGILELRFDPSVLNVE